MQKRKPLEFEDITAPLIFLKSVAQYYKVGGFNDKDIPVRVLNALDSLSNYFEE